MRDALIVNVQVPFRPRHNLATQFEWHDSSIFSSALDFLLEKSYLVRERSQRSFRPGRPGSKMQSMYRSHPPKKITASLLPHRTTRLPPWTLPRRVRAPVRSPRVPSMRERRRAWRAVCARRERGRRRADAPGGRRRWCLRVRRVGGVVRVGNPAVNVG